MPNETLTTNLSKTYTAIAVGNHTFLMADGADLSNYPSEVLDLYLFEYASPNTGDMIRISDALLDYNLRRDSDGNYSPAAYRLAYSVSFCRTVCSKITIARGSGDKTVIEGKGVLDRADVEKIPLEILSAFSQFADPTAITDADIDALIKKKKVKPVEAGQTPTSE